MSTFLPLRLEKSKTPSQRITVEGSGRKAHVFRGNNLVVRIAIFDASGAVADLADHASLNLAYMPDTRAADAIALSTASIEDAAFTEAEWLAGTHWHAEFTFDEVDTNPDLGGLSKDFWLVCYGILSGSGYEVTHGGSTLTVEEDGTNNTVASPDPPEVGVTAAQVIALIEDNPASTMTGEEIKVTYEGEPNTNAYTDIEKAKLAAIDAAHYGAPLQDTAELAALAEASITDKERRYVEDDLSDYFYDATAATGDVAPDDQTGGIGFWRQVAVGGETAASIKAKYESNADTNAFLDIEKAKLADVESGATADQTGVEIKVLYEAQSDTNAYTDAEQSKLAAVDVDHYRSPVVSETALAALEESTLLDNERRFVASEVADYFYFATATSGDVAPADQTGGTGWWVKLTAESTPGGSSHVGSPVATQEDLTGLPVAGLVDKERRYVEEFGVDCFWDAEASRGDFEPDDKSSGSGYWLKAGLASKRGQVAFYLANGSNIHALTLVSIDGVVQLVVNQTPEA